MQRVEGAVLSYVNNFFGLVCTSPEMYIEERFNGDGMRTVVSVCLQQAGCAIST